MKADREMPVKVMLNYGSFIQELSLEVGTTYRKYPVHFSAFDHKVKDATFSICPQKEGRLWIGTASLMPDDHIDGFPGGCAGFAERIESSGISLAGR